MVKGDVRQARKAGAQAGAIGLETRDMVCIQDEGWARVQPIAAALAARERADDTEPGRRADVVDVAERAGAESGSLWFGAAFADAAPLVDTEVVEKVAAALSSGRTPTLRPTVGSTPGCWPQGTGSNIARDFLIRGMYAPHLRRLLGHLPRDRVLVLLDSELKQDANGTMRRVTDFLGLPPFDFASTTEESMGEHFARLYPRFEDASGWALQGGYEPIPKDVEAELAAFYRPYNRALEAMLGVKTGWKGT